VSRSCSQLTVQCTSVNNNGAEITSYTVNYYRVDQNTVNARTVTISDPFRFGNNNPTFNEQQDWNNRQLHLNVQDGVEYIVTCRAENRIGFS
jgi:hypothetical protein